MKKGLLGMVVIVLLVLAAVAWAKPGATTSQGQREFQFAASIACGERGVAAECPILSFSRNVLGNNVAYYKALVKVGTGEHDVIGVARLVRESQPGVPVHTTGSFFFIHGSSETFNQVMVMPHKNRGMGWYLASNDIDVWGIDLRYVQIPASITDVSFASTWGFDVQISDVLFATRMSRIVRVLTLQGTGGINLSGHSSGAALTYAVANAEAELPQQKRDVAGLIPIDITYKLPASATVQIEDACGTEAFYRDNVNVGAFDNSFAITMGNLALNNPHETSPFDSSLTNLQFLLQAVATPSWEPVYPFHAWAVLRDSSGIATAGRYTPTYDIGKNLATSPPYTFPNAMAADKNAISCSDATKYDDNLGDVRVPILYVGAAGGFGSFGEYTPHLLGSEDVTITIIQLQSDPTTDFGHMDTLTARDPSYVWEPIRKWIVDHRH